MPKTTAPKVKKTSQPKKVPAKKEVSKTAPKKEVSKTAPKKAVSKTAPKKAVQKVQKSEPVLVVAPVPEVVAPVPEVSETPYAEEFSTLVSALDSSLTTIRDLKSRIQKLEKRVHRDHKANLKKVRGRKKRVRDPNAEPAGFAKPGPVSEELRKFLSLGKDETIARTAVTQRINKYCKENNLQDLSDKRKIIPDTSLRELLKMKKTDELTFFNLQKYMKIHFPNKEGVFPTA